MPSLVTKNGKKRYRASVAIPGQKKKRKQKLFPDDSKRSYKQAVLWEEKIKKELETQTATICVTVIEWAEKYLDDVERRFVRKTYDEKRGAFVKFMDFKNISDQMPVEQIDITLADSFLSYQYDTRSGYAANKDRKNLARAWDWGVQRIPKFPQNMMNPFRAIEKMSEDRAPRYVPPEEDFWRVYEVASGQDKVMLLASLNLATRRGELFRLKRSDIDFTNMTVTLWTRKRKGGHLEPDTLPMTNELKRSLVTWCEKRLSHDTEDKDHVFVCLNRYQFCRKYYGKPFKNRQHFMKKICTKAGVKKFGFHAIRHLTASMLYRKGYSVSFIQKVLRHKNPTTTERYLRSLGLEDVREGMNEALSAPGTIISYEKEKTLRTVNSKG